MAGASKRILRETTHQTTNADGELLEEKRITESYVTPEPEFVKLYLQHVLMLKKLPKSHHDVLMGVLKEMNWNNRVYLAGKLKRDMLAYLGISLASFDKALKSFVTEGILFQEERGLYVVNPHIFGKGKWEEIKKIRLSVTYDSSGGTFSAVIDKAKNKSFSTL